MPAYPAEAIVLHRVSLGETDRIVTLLTLERGKLNAVAKGSRRPGAKLAGASELFTRSRMLLAEGRNLDIITQCQVVESFMGLRADLALLARATYLCELADRLLEEHEPDEDAFHLLETALHLLEHSGSWPDVVVHAFELRLLRIRGYAPELGMCVRCGEGLPKRQGGFSPSLGGALCPACRYASDDAVGLSVEALEWLRRLAAEDPVGLIGQAPSPNAARDLNRCLRWFVRYHVERDLKSAEFLDMVRQTA